MTSYAESALVRSMTWLANAQGAIAHNLANANSTGFKRRQPIAEPLAAKFHSMLREPLPAVQYREVADWTPGNIVPTSERHHVALESQDWFRVRGADGQTFFTRNGELHVDAQGFLTDEAGFRYLDNAGNDVQIATDGGETTAVAIAPSGDLSDLRTGAALGRQLGVFRVADRDALTPVGHGRYLDTKAQDVVAVPTIAIRQGAVEASNVETVSELVNMLIVQRAFQANATVLRSVGQLHGSFVSAMNR